MTSVIPITNTTIPTPPPPVMPPSAPPPPPPSLPSPPSASSSAAAATSEDLGILQPPPDMRAIIDKTASWVARHGNSFEQKVKEKQKDASQFLFLRPGNPYYAYYQQKVREIRRVEVIAEIGDKESVENAAEIKMAVKKTLLGELPLESDLENLNRGKPKKRLDSAKKENLEPPPKEIWVLEKPNISALQDDIIKLSAQFVARNGRAFQSGLLEREHKNSQFGFLQPYHPLHQYFKKLVTDYTRILLPERGTVERLQELSSDKQAIINSVMKKAHWEKAQKKTEEEKRKEEEAERNAMALIDWHDFTVVQTIEWDDEEEEEIEEEGPNEPEIIPPPPQPTLPPKPPAEPVPQLPKAVPQNEESDDMDVGEDDEFSQEAQRTDLPVRHDYNPRDVRTSGSTTLKYITPSGQQIYPAEAEITMRIELSNSKVIEQRKAEAMNERDSNLAEGEEISRHLKNFVKNRNDIFGDELGLPEEPKKPVIEKPTWDGHSSSIQRVAMEALNGVNMQQIKALHDSKVYSGELSEPTIGPKLATTTRTPNATITTRPPEPARPQPPAPPRPQPIIPPTYSGTLPPFQPPMIRPPFPIQLPSHFNPPRLVPPMMTTMPPIPKEDAEEPPMKRAKIKEKKDEITKNLISEKEFLDTHPGSVNIVIKVPNQPPGSTKWPPHLNGQTYRVQVNTSDNIKTLKQKLADLLGMPANKQKLRAEGLGFLKDAKTLAFYNATDNIEVELGVKERGGRKK